MKKIKNIVDLIYIFSYDDEIMLHTVISTDNKVDMKITYGGYMGNFCVRLISNEDKFKGFPNRVYLAVLPDVGDYIRVGSEDWEVLYICHLPLKSIDCDDVCCEIYITDLYKKK